MRNAVILDVNPDPDALDWEDDWLERQDVDVVRCQGPHAAAPCPLLLGHPCGKVLKADGVLFQLNLAIPDHREILRTYAKNLDVPIRAVVSTEHRATYADLLADVEVATAPMGPAGLDGFAAEVASNL